MSTAALRNEVTQEEVTGHLGHPRLIRLRRRSLIPPQEFWILGSGPGGSLSDEAVNDRSVSQRYQPRDGSPSIESRFSKLRQEFEESSGLRRGWVPRRVRSAGFGETGAAC